jgi:hypothetical protein
MQRLHPAVIPSEARNLLLLEWRKKQWRKNCGINSTGKSRSLAQKTALGMTSCWVISAGWQAGDDRFGIC